MTKSPSISRKCWPFCLTRCSGLGDTCRRKEQLFSMDIENIYFHLIYFKGDQGLTHSDKYILIVEAKMSVYSYLGKLRQTYICFNPKLIFSIVYITFTINYYIVETSPGCALAY